MPAPPQPAVAPQSAAKRISPSGVVVGYSYTAAGPKHAFLWRNGTMTDLGTLGGSYSEPYGVNALGQVVGVAQTPDKYPHAFLWDDGVMTDLGTLGGSLSYALAVNERGQVVGYSDYNPLSNNTHAFLWQDGAMTDLGPFGHCCFAGASAINNRGQAVGSGPVGSGGTHAFLWQDGAMIDLGTLGGRLSTPAGVNGRSTKAMRPPATAAASAGRVRTCVTSSARKSAGKAASSP